MMDVLLEKVKLVFGKEDLADAAEMILLIIESIVEQMYVIILPINDSAKAYSCNRYISEDSKMQEDTETTQAVSTDNAISQMAMFLDNLASPLVRNNPKVTKTMTRIIPFLTYGNERYEFSYTSILQVLISFLVL